MLYNSYRPTSFKGVLGQPSAVYLKAAILRGTLPHSLLLSGTRGVGKTTLARIAARALNCEALGTEGVEVPCGVCKSCKQINHPDIYEIDSTVHGNPAALSSLQERMSLIPTYKKKVFILDEAHTITPKGMAMLLKTVEEPSVKCHIFLLTTEPDKIDDALRSRCTWLRLNYLTKLDIMKLIARVSVKEEIKINKAAVAKLADYAAGSARDALSMLELLKSYDKITEDLVDSISGHKVDCSKLLDALNKRDSRASFVEVANLCMYHEPKIVLAAFMALVMKCMDDEILGGGSPKKYLEWLTGPLRQAKDDIQFSYDKQLTIELAIAEIIYKSEITPRTLDNLDWEDFCYYVENEKAELAEKARSLRFVRVKGNKAIVCKQKDKYKTLEGLDELQPKIQDYFKNPSLTMEIL